ncbi:MAG: DUF3375 family protein [Planctomycetota bacterium]|nr:MAG: DUF3375 family protein [Planctomycetota bacterium]
MNRSVGTAGTTETKFASAFESSAAVRFLRASNARWMAEFFDQTFRGSHSPVPHSRAVDELSRFLRSISLTDMAGGACHTPRTRGPTPDQPAGETFPEDIAPSRAPEMAHQAADTRKTAERYLQKWSSREVGWLRRFIDSSGDEPLYELTPAIERALLFLEELTVRRSAGTTASRLAEIIRLLRGAAGATEAEVPEEIRRLEAERDAIQARIDALRNGRSRDTDLQVQMAVERVQLALDRLGELRSEFRTVEERFRQISRQLQARILAGDASRGELLQQALDEEQLLDQHPAGRSFREFLRMIHDPRQQSQLQALTAAVESIPHIAREAGDIDPLRRLVPVLVAEAEKILKTTQQLSQTLRRLLDGRQSLQRRQLATVLRDILSQAAGLSESPPHHIGIEVEAEMDIQSPLDRPFWSAQQPFAAVELQEISADPGQRSEMLAQLATLHSIPWAALRKDLQTLGDQHPAGFGWSEIVGFYRGEFDVIDVLALIQIAHDDGQRIDNERSETIELSPAAGPQRLLRVPAVEFRTKRRPHAEDRSLVAPQGEKR